MKTQLFAIFILLAFISFSNKSLLSQPLLESRSVSIIQQGDFKYKDLNKNNELDIYEDWRKPIEERISDLIGQMTLEEKVGMLLINTLNADNYGKVPERAVQYIEDEKMTRFIFRNKVANNPIRGEAGDGFRGTEITPFEAAQFMNAIQELAENTRLGIPAMFKSNARNHIDFDARAGINVGAGAFSSWPKENGLAATRDMELIAEFADIMRQEWTAIGLRGMYGYMADLSTEPRWYRIHETFTEDSELASDIIKTLVENLQGKQLNSKSVALTIKHFPGGGPQEGGGDPHYDFGKNQVYPGNNFDYHLAPFQAAVDAGASSIMAYYGIPVGQKYMPNNVGMAFSKGILTDLLRKNLGFKGYVNSDTGIIGSRAWGLEDKSTEEQIIIALEAGTDVLSGFSNNKQLLDLVTSGKLAEERVDVSVKRLLKEQFELGLFENPFVNANRAAYWVGNPSFQRKAEIAQRKSIVMLQNKMNLPLKINGEDEIKILTYGMDTKVFEHTGGRFSRENNGGIKAYTVNFDSFPDIEDNTDFAIIRVNVSNARTRERMFGGAEPDELDFLAFSDMAKAKSWIVSPSLENIQNIMDKIGAEKTIISIEFRQPYVLDEDCGLLNAGAIFATFGVTDAALVDIITGKFKPTGKLPFALAKTPEAILKQNPDEPGYQKEDTLFPFGFGLSY
jgi:beta-glucosidase